MTQKTTLTAGGKTLAIIPQSFEDVQRVAKAAIAAGVGPATYKDDDEVSLAKATTAIMTGLELGVPPMQSLQNIAVINGRPMIWGELVPALLLAHGFKLHTEINGEGDERTALARITRPNGDEIARTFSAKQAKDAGLWDERKLVKRKQYGEWKEVPNDSPWFCYRDDMLIWKAVARAVKFGAADVTKGLAVREDMVRPDRDEPIDITPTKDVEAIPDIPDEPVDEIPDIEEVPDDTIADPDGLIKKIEEDIAIANGDKTIIAELSDQYQDIIERLPEGHRGTANALLEQAA